MGVTWREWHRLTECLVYTAARVFGHSFELLQPWRHTTPGRAEVFGTIERRIVAQQPVLIMLAGAHYSVIRGFTPLSFLLFDSSGREWIKRHSLGVRGAHHAAVHRIVPSATMALRRRS